MPIIDFPKGPMATPEAYPIDQPEEPDIGVADIATNVVKIATKKTDQCNCFVCSDCGSAVFFLYDDGEIECANPRCGGVISGIMVVEMGNTEA
jgi:hypothetical protein